MAKLKRKGLKGMIAAECANHRSGGTCLGADLAGTFCMPLGNCLVEMELPCSYFERCVLPMARRHPDYAKVENDYARATVRDVSAVIDDIQDEGLRDRFIRHPFCGHSGKYGEAQRVARFCECGAPLAKRKQRCPACQLKRRRETQGGAQRRWRNKVGVV